MKRQGNQPLINNDNPYAKDNFSDPYNNQSPVIPKDNSYPQDDPSSKDFAEYRLSKFAQDINPLRPQQSSMHCRAFLATFLFFGGLGLCIYLYFSDTLGPGGFFGISFGIYCLHLIVGLACNSLGQYLNNIKRGEQFQTSYDRGRALIGKFTFKAVCYHYETVYHTRTVTDSDGNSRDQSYTTTQTVTTHTATEHLTPTQTIDESGKADRIRSNQKIVFIHFFLRYRFVDVLSSNNLAMQYESFRRRNNFDTYQDYTMGYSLPGLIERQSFYVGDLECDYGTWMYLFGLIGLIWPYSLWVESKIARFSIDYMKSLRI